VRLCDFGSCAEVPIYVRNLDERAAAEEQISKQTTQMYRAPEMVDLYLRPVLTDRTDIWALGCMLYAMCFLLHPFGDGSTLGILNAKVNFPADSPFDPNTMHALILRLLDVSSLSPSPPPIMCTRLICKLYIGLCHCRLTRSVAPTSWS
jgi:cyclin G-associated kinase